MLKLKELLKMLEKKRRHLKNEKNTLITDQAFIPSLKTSILMGALVAFTLSIDDFVISFYTQGNGFFNFSNYVYSSYSNKNFSAGSYAFNALLTFVTLLLVFVVAISHHVRDDTRFLFCWFGTRQFAEAHLAWIRTGRRNLFSFGVL